MAHLIGRPTRLSIRQHIRLLIRTFPKAYVRIRRRREEYNDLGEAVPAYDDIYEGDVLVRPSGGTSETYGLGTVENYDLVVLLNGDLDVRQGDIVTINDGREYEVMFPPKWFDAFHELRLKQWSQIGQET